MPTLGPILVALNEAAIRYIIVGGVAVILRGYPRLTGDLDLVVDLSPDEALKAIRALESIGLRPTVPVPAEDFADPEARRRWIEEKGMRVFSMIDPADPMRHVDLFVEPPVAFDDLWARSDLLDAGGFLARTASIGDLIEMKRAAGRARDLDDIDALQQLRDNAPDG